jgi:tetratricopeptide (TPR) repeat protein
MQRATDAAVAAVRRADDFAAGGLPGEVIRAELESTRRAADDLARHTRLITASTDNSWRFADEMGGTNRSASKDLCRRAREALRQFGLDPIDGRADEVARAVASSRIRDAILGMMLEWHDHATIMAEALRRNPGRAVLPADAPVMADRLGGRFMVGNHYAKLEAYDQAIAAYRRVIAMSPCYTGIAHLWMGEALSKKKDWEAAIAALREAIRLLPERPARMYLPSAYLALGTALASAGRHAEGLQEMLSALRKDPTVVEDPMSYVRYNTASLAMNCAEGKGMNALAPVEGSAYRKQALELLTAELSAMRKLAASDRAFVHRMMQHWLGDADMASGRDPTAVEGLPAEEREAWLKLWADVRELRDRSAPQAESVHKSS